jgi:hypothetical protein
MSKFSSLVIVCAASAFVAPVAISNISSRLTDTPGAAPRACLIKGNISIDTGERIYHVPGQEYYEPTRILPRYGERWFCSEADARAAGWRKAKR